MNIEEKINELEKQLAELKAELNKDEPEFKNGNKYWFIDQYGEVQTCPWFSVDIDFFRNDVGNAFHTQEEAELALEKRKAEIELLKLCDWKKGIVYTFTQSIKNKDWGWLASEASFYCPYKFSTQKSCQAAIDQLGDRKLRLIYNIPLENDNV